MESSCLFPGLGTGMTAVTLFGEPCSSKLYWPARSTVIDCEVPLARAVELQMIIAATAVNARIGSSLLQAT